MSHIHENWSNTLNKVCMTVVAEPWTFSE